MPSHLHNQSYRELVEFLVGVRTGAGLTQVELGARLGKPQSFVSKVERQERRIDIIEFTAWIVATGGQPPKAYAALLRRLDKA